MNNQEQICTFTKIFICGAINNFSFSLWIRYPGYSGPYKSSYEDLGLVSQFSQFSCLVVSDSLWPHESQHARPPCPSPTPGVHSDWRLSSRWCHPAISSSIVPFSSCPQSLPASVFSNESTLHMRWPKYWSSISPSKEHPGLISFRMD